MKSASNSTIEMCRFVIMKNEFNSIMDAINFIIQKNGPNDEYLKVQSKLFHTSLLDKNKQEIHCMLSKSDFNILFNVLLEKIVNNSLKVKDYFQELTNNPETKLWIERK